MSEFEKARFETLRYHEELYASSVLGQAGSWLAKPHRLLGDALSRIPSGAPVTAYDLGAGIGRHTIPMLQQLPPSSEVYAVDLIASALDRIRDAVPPGIETTLYTRLADLNDFEFERPADLVLAFSAIEHLPDVAAIESLLRRINRVSKPGGVVAIGIVADRIEIEGNGVKRPALLESALSSVEATRLLMEVFEGFEVLDHGLDPANVEEQRDGERYTLSSTLVTWLAIKP